MRTDKRADEIFKKRYYLNDEQVKVMHETFNYQATVLRFYLRDIASALKAILKEIVEIIKSNFK